VKINNKQFNKDLGQKIKSARYEYGMTQEELAGRLGFSRIALSTYESGRSKLTVYQLGQIASILQQPIEYFLPPKGETEFTSGNKKEFRYNLDEDVDFVLEQALKNYLLSKRIKKSKLDFILQKTRKLLETQISEDDNVE
jgi:transcriptional regulator with XRE-family HTH domain